MVKRILFPAMFVILFAVLSISPVMALIRIDLDGNTIHTLPSVLGDNDDRDDEKVDEHKIEEGKDSSKQEEKNTEVTRKQEEQKREIEKKEIERVKEEIKKNVEQAKKIRETNREVVKKIEEKAKEEKQKSVEQIRLQNKASLKVTLASKSGNFEEVEDDELEMETEDGIIEFKNERGSDSVRITQGAASARTELPLSIDPKTKEVSVETDDNKIEVKVLPEEALRLVSDDKIFGSSSPLDPEKFDIVVENGRVVYLINDTKDEKFLGLFSVSIPKEVKVFGDTGEATLSRQKILNRVLDFLSI